MCSGLFQFFTYTHTFANLTNLSCQKQFQTTSSVMGDVFVTQEEGMLHVAVAGAGRFKCMTSCQANIQNMHWIKSRVHCETFQATYC